MSTIWTDAILNQYAVDAMQDIAKSVNCIYHRFYQATQVGVGVYTLPTYVKGIIGIQWRGSYLDAMNWYDLVDASPSSVFVSSAAPENIENAVGRPQWYALHPTNVHDFKLYPAPSVAYSAAGGDPYSPLVEDRCIVTCWRNIDDTDPLFRPPDYILRRTVKAFVLWKAFGKDGKGQDLKASSYYKKVYDFLIDNFTKINAGAFCSKVYGLRGAPIAGRRPAHPVLPANFERNY